MAFLLFITFIFLLFFTYGVGLDVVLGVHFCFHRAVVIHEYCLEENRVRVFLLSNQLSLGLIHHTASMLHAPLRDSPLLP